MVLSVRVCRVVYRVGSRVSCPLCIGQSLLIVKPEEGICKPFDTSFHLGVVRTLAAHVHFFISVHQ